MKRPRIYPPVYWFLALIAMVLLHRFAPVATLTPYPWNLIGVLPFLLGALLNLAASSTFRKARTTIIPYRKSSALLTTGVFRFSRNPIYLGGILLLAGIALLLGTLSPWAMVPAFAVAIRLQFIPVEERMMEEAFGDEWHAYCGKVRRWL